MPPLPPAGPTNSRPATPQRSNRASGGYANQPNVSSSHVGVPLPHNGSHPHYAPAQHSVGSGNAGQGIPPIPQTTPTPKHSFLNTSGCLAWTILAVVLVVVFGITRSAAPGDATDITPSTVQRTALAVGSVNETGYYTDELGWIKSPTRLQAGLRNFYQKTGIQPYVYITDTIAGTHAPTADEVEIWINSLYDELFTDEAHFLLVFFEYDDVYQTWYMGGAQTKTVMDGQASDILLDYIDSYYYDQDLTDEQMFSNAFSDAADRIMSVTTSPWIPVWIVFGIVAILVVIFIWWRHAKKQNNLEAAQKERVLNAPLTTFGSIEAQTLAQKYENQPHPPQ